MALSCAPPVEEDATSGARPANRPPDRPPAGWSTPHGERRVCCSALLGLALLEICGELARAAKDGGDLHQTGTDSIHDAKGADDELS